MQNSKRKNQNPADIKAENKEQRADREMEAAWRLRRYMSPPLVSKILEASEHEPFGIVAKRKRVTFMFLDIRNFTEMSDELEPEVITDVLNEYYTVIDGIITKYGGNINKFLGDGLLVIFGDPVQNREHKLCALKAGFEIMHAVRAYSKQVSFLPVGFKIGIGINSGKAVLGAFGPQNHVDYTAIGSAVNIAARLQGLAKNDEVVASMSTFEGLEDEIDISNKRAVTVKGLSEPLWVGDVIGIKQKR